MHTFLFMNKLFISHDSRIKFYSRIIYLLLMNKFLVSQNFEVKWSKRLALAVSATPYFA